MAVQRSLIQDTHYNSLFDRDGAFSL